MDFNKVFLLISKTKRKRENSYDHFGIEII